ncbi:MAG: DUF3788 domain-containing protein [Calditrichales bacterium]|nr:DUF3788 domain-containing protein [Calditrichales bacterium]
MGNLLLKDPDVFPSAEVLEKVLDKKYSVFMEFISTAESEEFKLIPNWRYYKDGKAWFCKITLKKKTVLWLSVWSDCFKVAFYFTEKSGAGIPRLKIDDSIKEFYLNHKPIGKLKPIVVEVRRKSQLVDINTLIKYKSGQL